MPVAQDNPCGKEGQGVKSIGDSGVTHNGEVRLSLNLPATPVVHALVTAPLPPPPKWNGGLH